MDGKALYEAVARIFIAQVNGINLKIAEVIIVIGPKKKFVSGFTTDPIGLRLLFQDN